MELISMGFDPEQCQAALQRTGGNLEQAVNLLLTSPGGIVSSEAPPQASSVAGDSDSVRMVHATLSQYAVDNGRSACTCIALKAAGEILTQLTPSPISSNSSSAPAPSVAFTDIVTPDLLKMSILGGVEIYNNMKLIDASVEHKSAEEVLTLGAFPLLRQEGPVMQGMLSNDANAGLGLNSLVSASQDETKWTCVVITKPPETVLVVLSPSTAATPIFALVDSHPRPQQFGAEQGYARIHSTLSGLILSLNTIFPCTDLGPDIPELIAAMYNQFDLYRFRRS